MTKQNLRLMNPRPSQTTAVFYGYINKFSKNTIEKQRQKKEEKKKFYLLANSCCKHQSKKGTKYKEVQILLETS